MSRLVWNAPERRFFETGLDRGVLYPKKTPPMGSLIYTNLVRNPEFGVNLSSWSVPSSGVAAAVAEGNRKVFKMTATGSAGVNWVGTGYFAALPTQSFAIAFDVKLLGNQASQVTGYRIYIDWYNNNTLLSTTQGAFYSVSSLYTTGYTTLTATGTAPGSTTQFFVRLQPTYQSGVTTLPNGMGLFLMNPIVTKGSMQVPYFSALTPSDATYSYYWTGTPHLSSSEQRLTVSLATPWEGLTSVEESGGEAARAYFVDGRPFLFMPVPKEFSATLNAYTYPDSFAEVMGLAEVTDGMYLDSQMGAPFDLTYRTKVGNAVEGQDHGYKIHLIYNATVTPGALTYETMGDSVNPTTMSWAIQAVPVKVEGFRSTAHIVVDTRHMDTKKVASFEALLYGDDDTTPSMPSPQAVFDLLNYGDMIVVTDNGDGTFDVEGSYENVYMYGNGEFRIENVDGQNNGDGTFTISTTNG